MNKPETTYDKHATELVTRAQGCLLGQLAGDALGGLVEFRTPSDIRKEYPDGVRKLADGGTWNTIAGQPTDDSEMALMLARMLADLERYDPAEARKAYDVLQRIDSHPAEAVRELTPRLWKERFADRPLRSDVDRLGACAEKVPPRTP